MYVQWASFPFKIFPLSKRLAREVQSKALSKISFLKTTDRNSDTTKYEQNHIPMRILILALRKNSPRKFESFELCTRVKRYVSFQWKSHGTKLNMKRRQTAACMFKHMSKIGFLSGVLLSVELPWCLPIWGLFIFDGNTFSRLNTRKNYNRVTSFHWLVPYYLLPPVWIKGC